MGYPNQQYRPTRVSMDRGSFQSPSPKPGTILRFPESVSEGKKRRQLQRQRKGKTAHRVKKVAAGSMRAAHLRTARRDLTGYAQRVALRNQALRGLKAGIRFRSMLFRSVAGFVLQNLFDIARTHHKQSNPAFAKHPLWGVIGRWGMYPFDSGKTNSHTLGSTMSHNAPPPVFAHPWSGAPFAWAEFDTAFQPFPITFPARWDAVVVGRGFQGTGPSPASFYASITNLPAPFELTPHSMKNPWGDPYNPSWNRMPNRWPEGFPKPVDLPLPSGLDDFSWPVYAPTPLPFPMPYASLPHRRPNPFRDPKEQTSWGPMYRPRVRTEPEIAPDPFGLPDIINWPRPNPGTDPLPPFNPPVVRPPTVTTMEPGKPTRTRVRFRPTRKPEKRTKERKIKATVTAARFIMKIINGVTETSDFVRALHKALPKKYQRGGKLVMDQWKDVYEHWDEIDVLHGLRSIARDQLEDLLYGKLGRLSGKAANRRGGLYDPFGRAMRKLSQSDYEAGVKHDPIKLLLDSIFGEDT